MKWLWWLFIPALAFGQAQEILRATVDVDGGSTVSNALDASNCVSIAVYVTSVALPNWYDAAGLSTNSPFHLTNTSPSVSKCSARVLKTWATTSNTYTALTLNINTSGVVAGNGGRGSIFYSTDGGNTWNLVRQPVNNLGWAQVTDSVTLSPTQDLTKLQVAANDAAFNADPGGTGNGDMLITGFDVWTAGTYTVVAPATPQPPPPVVAISPVVISYIHAALPRHLRPSR